MGRKKTISDAELLDVARGVFVERGFAVSTKEIARRAGISEGVIFQRFTTKEELFFAAMIPPSADLDQLLRSPLAGRESLEAITFAMIDYFRATLPILLPLMSHPAFRFEEFAARHPDSPMLVLRRELVEFFVREQRAGRIGAVEPGAAALLVWATAHSIPFFERLGAHGGTFGNEIVRATVRGIWDGLGGDRK